MKPYLLLSDIHAHSWSAFSTTTAEGINSRLQIILDEIKRAAAELKAAGGNRIVLAGDLFHVRGSIDPEVFNPVYTCFESLIFDGFEVEAIPGNHDLKSKDTSELGNAFQAMSGWADFRIHTHASFSKTDSSQQTIAFVPYRSTRAALLEDLEDLADATNKDAREEMDVIIHAGIDGVLPVPDHGLTPEMLTTFGFKRIFAGDYHNHKVLADGKVISIGATTHQTWSDIGSKAGFLIVYPDRFEYRASNAPDFVEINGDMDEDELFAAADGNYVRVRGMKMTDTQIKEFREELMKIGARGVSFQVTREVVSARTGAVPTKAVSLEASIDGYVDTLTTDADVLAAAKAMCAEIMTTVRSVEA